MENSKFNEQDQINTENQSEQTQPASSLSETNIDYKDQFLRTTADLNNFKRRVEKERSEWMTAAQSMVIEKLLPIVDDLDRALVIAQKNVTADSVTWLDGIKLIQKNLLKTLSDLGVQEVDASGAFNPEFHEALASVESSEKASGDIVEVFFKGYSFKGKVIKHAQVSVAK
jgi:molecular chaperone GrpE